MVDVLRDAFDVIIEVINRQDLAISPDGRRLASSDF